MNGSYDFKKIDKYYTTQTNGKGKFGSFYYKCMESCDEKYRLTDDKIDIFIK